MFNPPQDLLDRPFQALGAHKDLIHNVSFDHHGRRMATCSTDMTMVVWDRKPDGTWKRSAIWKVHGGAVWRAIWAHPEFGQILATCSYDRNINIWEEQFVKKGKRPDKRTDADKKQTRLLAAQRDEIGNKRKTHWVRRYNISDCRSNVTDIAFAPRHIGLVLASCTALGSIRIYEAPNIMDISRWSLNHELQAFHTRCGCITWSQSRMHKSLIAVGSDEKTSESTQRIVIYENADGLRKWQRIIAIKLDLPAPVTDLRFSPISLIDSHQLAIAAGDVHIYCIKVSKSAVVDDDTGEAIGENPVTSSDYSAQKVALLGDVRKAWRVKYNVMGSVVTATSFDGTVRSWKSLFVNQWVKLTEMSADDYTSLIDGKPKQKQIFLSEKIGDNDLVFFCLPVMSLGCSVLDKQVADWLAWDKNEKTLNEIRGLVEKKDVDGLKSRMSTRLVFGTAGVRSPMQAGFGRLNDLTIIQITHGFARHMIEVYGQPKTGVAIGFDGRHNSRRFAELASNVFIRNNIPVYLFSEVSPTPVVSWATIKLGCDAGLIITASHNPKEDNGYKAYWSNGAQIIGPHDDEIVRLKESEPQPRDEYWDLSQLRSSPLFHSADVVIDPYFEVEKSLNYYRELNQKTPIKFTYSAFHGIGYHYTKRMFSEFGFPENSFISVAEQQEPNPDFPTIPFPNPEEGKKVLTLAIETADKNNSTVILANDPDADRIQLAEKQSNGEWRVFTGNEMGAIITWWIWTNWRKANPTADPSKVYILNSAVSSQIVKTIADFEGFRNETTLTGFKWMGNRAEELRAEGNQVILAWEESIGYMPGHTMDKDGVSAAAVFAEIATYLRNEGKSLQDQLYSLYNKYGFHLVRSTYWFVPGPEVTKNLFATLRENLKFPEKIGNEPVASVRDLTIGYDNSKPDNKPVLPLSTSSEMVTFFLKNGSITTLRASGTEPKIKYYIELVTAPGKTQNDLDSVIAELDQLENDVVATLLRPQQFGLIPRK
ncbi:unnamed protein product [Caenorhabditis angaria]|uniref:Uncharacterized protein n=1 Tax=Caenorhabditis angaria TaxID=860376 RepID=A0A9P1II42_9PELO|nr:unnamed protein product [Caenorhabditis angaria]